MDKQKTFSHGLLYSVPPESFFSLHLKDEERLDVFEWDGFKSNLSGISSITRYIFSFLKNAIAGSGANWH